MAPPRFGSVVLTYFIIGVVLFGGGVVGPDNTGLVAEVVDIDNGEVEANQSTGEGLQNLGGPIEQAVASVGGGGLLAVWIFIKGLLGAIFWPIGVLSANNAPPVVTALLGGGLSMAFLVATLLLIRGSS